MIKRIKAVGEIGRNYEKVRDATFALERFVCSNLCNNPRDPFYGEIIKDYLRQDVRREYNAYVHDNKLTDNAVSILAFLKRAVKVKKDDEKGSATLRGKKDKDKSRKKVKKSKTKNVEKPKETPKIANYQFFRSPCSESSTEDSTSSDSGSDSDTDSSSSDDANCNAQTTNQVCDFCEGMHHLFKCIKFFYELTYKERRKWVEAGQRCPLCPKVRTY